MIYLFKEEPKEKIYYSLLDFLKTAAKEFILVKRMQLEFDNNAEALLKELSSNLMNKIEANQWPGTKLLGQANAEIYRFEANLKSIDILKRYSKGLSDWLAPKLPEDLTFFRKDNGLIFGSVIHEKEYWLDLNETELNTIINQYPDLGSILMKK
jgi:hypothetical protein